MSEFFVISFDKLQCMVHRSKIRHIRHYVRSYVWRDFVVFNCRCSVKVVYANEVIDCTAASCICVASQISIHHWRVNHVLLGRHVSFHVDGFLTVVIITARHLNLGSTRCSHHLAFLAAASAPVSRRRPIQLVEVAATERGSRVAEARSHLHILAIVFSLTRILSGWEEAAPCRRVHRGIGSGQTSHHFCHSTQMLILLTKLYVHIVPIPSIVCRIFYDTHFSPLVYWCVSR